jgi:predicted deacetylase
VAIHDVEPRAFARCVEIRGWLAERGVDRATLLVIPAPRLHPFDSVSPELAGWLRSRTAAGDCVAQHGLRHLRTHSTGPVGALHAAAAGGASAEFAGLDGAAAAAVLDAGRAVLAAAGLGARGFVAPAYLYTRPLRAALPARFAWWADRWSVHAAGGSLAAPALCLGTSTGVRRRSSPALVRALAALQRRGPLRLDVHPADFDHPGHVAALEGVIERAAGVPCVTYDRLASAAGRRTAASGPHRHRQASVPTKAAAAAAPPRRR